MKYNKETLDAAKNVIRGYLRGNPASAGQLEEDLCGVPLTISMLHYAAEGCLPWHKSPFSPAIEEMILSKEVTADASPDGGIVCTLRSVN